MIDALLRDLARLELLIRDGKGDGAEADAVRDGMDAPWHALSEADRARAEAHAVALQAMGRAAVERRARR